MKKVLLLALFIVFVTWSQAYADYSFSFTNSSWGVTGDIIATSNGNGTFTVTGGSLTGDGTADSGDVFVLVPGGLNSVVQNVPGSGGANLDYDNQYMPNSSTVFTSNGLAFVGTNNGLTGLYINIWGNSPGNYTLALFGDGNNGYEQSTDNVEVTPDTASPTPIPGAEWLFGSGLAGLIGLKRKYLG